MAIEYSKEFEKYWRKLEADHGDTWQQKDRNQNTWYLAQISLLESFLKGGLDWGDIEKSFMDELEELEKKAKKPM